MSDGERNMASLTDAVSDTAFAAPPGRPTVLAVVRQPANAAAGAKNRCVVVALGVERVLFTLFDAAGKAVGPATTIGVVEGTATHDFTNPAAGSAYRLVAEDVAGGVKPVRTNAFTTTAAVVTPPAPPPVKPSFAVDPVAPAKPGEMVTLTVRSAGMAQFDWTAVNPDWTWRSNPPNRVAATGTDKVTFELQKAGDFVKLMSTDRTVLMDVPVPVATPAPAPVEPTPAATAARDFAASLVAGMNIERGRPLYMQYQGKALNQSVDYYRYLASLGLTHVRFFMAVRPNLDMLGMGLTNGRMPDAALIDKLLDACDCAAAAGLKVLVDWTDVISDGELQLHWDALARYFDLVCDRILARPKLGPGVLATGAFNELEVEQNTAVNKYRLDAHAAFRRRLPQHALLTGASYWNAWDHLTDKDWAMVGDKNTIAQWHHYEDALRGQPFWANVATRLGEFSSRNGIPVIAGEAGPDEAYTGQHVAYSDRWLTSMKDQAAALPGQGLTWWAVTDGGAFRFSRGGTDATIRPELEAVIKATSATLRRAQGGKI